MIRHFGVENYLSIRDRQELSFLSKSRNPYFSAEVVPGVFLNKLGIFYGANASGKSNILFAIRDVFRILAQSRATQDDSVLSMPAFILDRDKSTQMYISFYVDKIRYDYEVEYTPKHILREELYYYPSRNKSLFYQRKFKGEGLQAEIKFGASLGLKAQTQRSLAEQTLNNHSLLSSIVKVSLVEDISIWVKVFEWARGMVQFPDIDIRISRVKSKIKEVWEGGELNKFYLEMLSAADFNIVDFLLREHLLMAEEDEGDKRTYTSLRVRHSCESESFDLPLELESKGTVQYINILESLYRLVAGSCVYLVDELDQNLHYGLLLHYLNVFLYNSRSSQLFFTSHQVELLAEDLLNDNRDLVWFVEKDPDSSASAYYRADSYGLHKNLSLYKSYRIGRLGAKPELGSFFVN